MSLHRGRKQLLQHQQSILDVQKSVAHLRQELQARTQVLQVSAPSVFAWPLCVPPATLGGEGLGQDAGAEGEDDLPGAPGGGARPPSYGSYYRPGGEERPCGRWRA